MGHKQWPSCQVTDSSLSFVGLSSARTGPCRQRRTAAKAVPAPARSIRPLGHAKTVLNIGHFGACLAIFHSVCQKGTGGKCLNIRKHRVSLKNTVQAHEYRRALWGSRSVLPSSDKRHRIRDMLIQQTATLMPQGVKGAHDRYAKR